MPATTIDLTLDEETRNRLKKLGKLRDCSPHWLMKNAVEEYLAREEAYETEKAEDMARWRHYQDTGKFVSHTQVISELEQLRSRLRAKMK